jgi:proliferating cell nuclear antigen
MLQFSLPARDLKKIILCVSDIIEELSVTADNNGLKSICMDSNHISMLSLNIKRENFEEFSVDSPVDFTVNTEELRKITNRGRPDEIALITVSKNMTIKFRSQETSNVRNFSLNLIDPTSSENFKLPEIPYKAIIETIGFDEALKDNYLINESASTAVNENFKVFSEGDSGTVEVIIKEFLQFDVEESCESAFNLPYLIDVTKHIESTCKIKIGNQVPIWLQFEIGPAEIVYILAPRVSEEGET